MTKNPINIDKNDFGCKSSLSLMNLKKKITMSCVFTSKNKKNKTIGILPYS